MKRILTTALLLVMFVASYAQFEKGKKYVGAYSTGLGLSYSSGDKLRFSLGAEGGYFIADNFMVKANAGYEHTRHADDFSFGLGGRYYFQQNGIFLGAGGEYVHHDPSNNDVLIPVEVGYAFFLNRYVTIQPALYYKMSINDFSDGSTVGLKIGLGFYF